MYGAHRGQLCPVLLRETRQRGVTGLRVFHDYLRERHPEAATLDKLFALEWRFCRCEPYWRLGRYLHYTLHRPVAGVDASFRRKC